MNAKNPIPLSILEEITNGFSVKSRIGRGGYADIYKGVYNQREIAVKLLHVDTARGLGDQQFKAEIGNLLRVKHRNIVQLVGYCYETKKIYVERNGAGDFSEHIYRAICFEYLQGGSLDKHLDNQSFAPDWSTRYNIMKGICEGLNFLHKCKPPILHLDLKPANILLDSSMEPKVADLGLSRLCTQSNTHVTEKVIGTRKYMPPEFIEYRIISLKNDIFSLGVVMIEIMTGPAGCSNSFEIGNVAQLDQRVLAKWTSVIKATSKYPSDEKLQVQTCIELAMRCVDSNRDNRPCTTDILDAMNKTETNIPKRQKDISSIVQGQCNEQTKQCKFYQPQSFSSHYPTNMKYLGRESERAVDVARGAMGSLLDKLGKLVTEDYSLDMNIKSDLESLSVDLTKIHLGLPELKNCVRAKVFVDEVRELSYNTENMIDSFLVHVVPDSSGSGFREIMHESVKLLENGITTHHQIGDVITDIKDKVQAVSDRQKRYNFNLNNVVANAPVKATADLRISAMYEHKEQLVGIKALRDELIRRLEEDGDASKQKLKIISIVGMGGLGKTTLAKAVYDKMKAYRPKAFISVGQNPDVETVLKKILHKFQKDFNAENLDMGELIDKLKKILKDRRYFIVIDDIWDSTAWGFINYVFPRNKHGSRVITTTRNHDVALACCSNASKYVYRIQPLSDEESRRLFIRRAFGPEYFSPDTVRKEEISRYILKKCGGIPLAINTIASLLAGEEETTWEYVWKSLHALTEGITALENMKKILDLSYVHLPDDLKTCLVYVCMYPEDSEIYKTDLLRQWVAEGFVSRKGRLDAEDVAENNFKALINMCLIEPGRIDRCNNEVLSCRVHDIILELMRSKSSEVNFIHVIDGLKDVSGQICRVSVQHNYKEGGRVLETIKGSLSHARSVFLYRGSLLPDFLKFKYVRVLHLERWTYEKDLDLNGISRLFLLRYLKIVCSWSSEVKLPDQIGALQQLDTIDLQGFEVKNYPPDIVSLPWLSHLRYGGWGVPLPDGIDRLKSLRTLVGVCVHRSSVDNIKGLGELTNLRELELISSENGQSKEATCMRMVALHSSICKLSASLRILTVGGAIKLDVRVWSRSIFPQVSNIRELDLTSCNFQRCPGWISQIRNLHKFTICVSEVADGLTIVAGLPSLAYYSLYSGDEKEESVVIPKCSGAFQALNYLKFRCPKTSLILEAGAMPKLEKLDMWFRYHMARRFLPIGIGLLQAGTLKEISLFMDDRKVRHFNHFTSVEYVKHCRRFRSMMNRAFKPHYPDADIKVYLDNCEVYDCNEDDEGVDDEEDCCNEGHEEGQQSGRSKDLAVSESLQLPSTNLFGPSPSCLHQTLAPCSWLDRAEAEANFPVDINNDLSVQLGNNCMLVNAVGQYVDLNQASPAGLVDLNQVPPDEATDTNSSN